MSKELELFDTNIQHMLDTLEEGIQQGENLKEGDFEKDTVSYVEWHYSTGADPLAYNVQAEHDAKLN